MSTVNTGTEHFGSIADKYDAHPSVKRISIAVAEHFQTHIAAALAPRQLSEAAVLDFGCGPGVLSARLSEHVAKVVCLDSAPEMVAKVEEKRAAGNDKLEGLCLTLTAPEQMEGRKFDVVLISLVLHHMPDPAAWFGTVVPLLNPGGVVVVYDLFPNEVLQPGQREGVHHHGFTQEEVEKLARDAGLTPAGFVEEVGKFYFPDWKRERPCGGGGHGHCRGHKDGAKKFGIVFGAIAKLE